MGTDCKVRPFFCCDCYIRMVSQVVYAIHAKSRIIPSKRIMIRFPKNNPKNQSNIEEATNQRKSKLDIPFGNNGVMVAEHPNIKNILKRLLPIIFPIAISGFFFMAATTDVASSGSEVPTATIVTPITASLIPIPLAMPIAPFTNSCPPKIKAASPTMMKVIDFHRGRTFISVSVAFSFVFLDMAIE